MTEQKFMEFVSALARCGSLVSEMSRRLYAVVECVKEGSFDRKTLVLENVDDEDILVHLKGSTKHLEMVGVAVEVFGMEEG